jgi:hypothetical protein
MYRFNKGNSGVPKYARDYPAFADEVINFYVSPSSKGKFTYPDPTPILSSSTVAYRCAEVMSQFLLD